MAKKTKKKASKKKKIATKARPKKTSKKKAAASKPKKKAKKTTSKKKKAATGAKKAKVKKTAAKPAAKAKAPAEPKVPETPKKGAIPLGNPYKLFTELWDSKNESYFQAIRTLFTEYSVPGANDKQREENSQSIIDKIEAGMRKEPIPDAITEQWAERFQRERIHHISSITAIRPRSTLRLNTLKADIKGFGGSRAASELNVKRTQFSPWAFDVPAGLNPSIHPVYEKGLYELEDEASQLATLLLNVRPGQRVLDMCARDGDHTLGISAMMRNKGSLFVYDADPNKLKVLKQRAQRAGVSNIRVVSDGQISEVKSLDAVLIAAPSSGTGLLARQPEIKWRYKAEDLPKIQKVQAALLREGARKLKLGGHLVYVTQSLGQSENEAQIEHFLRSSHSSFRLVPAMDYFREAVFPYAQSHFGLETKIEDYESFAEFDPFMMSLPDIHGCNGMFMAVIERVRISN